MPARSLPIFMCLWFCASSPADEEDLYIVSVGIEPSMLKKGKLDLYSRDAVHVRKAFVRSEEIFNTVRSRVLNGKRATPTEVIKGVSWLASEVTPKDTAIVFFSTHGDLDKKGDFYFSLAPEKPKQEAAYLYGSKFNKELLRIKGRVIVLADTCHAEALIPGEASKNISMITASRRDESSSGQYDDAKHPHGYYVIALCEGLRGMADKDDNGSVTLGELEDYITLRSHAMNREQTVAAKVLPSHRGLVLSRADAVAKREPLWGRAHARNPFGCRDVLEPEHPSVDRFVKRIGFKPDGKDPNAVAWNSKIVSAAKDSLDGEWESRWREGNKGEWMQGAAWIKTVGQRVFILYKDRGANYLLELRHFGTDVLGGRYMNLEADADTGAWAGKVVSPERIDGMWESGRWDLRRKTR